MGCQTCPARTVLMTYGEPGKSMFILAEGLLDVYAPAPDNGGEVPVGQIHPVRFLGEMSLLTGNARSATVVARTDSIIYEISRADLVDLLARVAAGRCGVCPNEFLSATPHPPDSAARCRAATAAAATTASGVRAAALRRRGCAHRSKWSSGEKRAVGGPRASTSLTRRTASQQAALRLYAELTGMSVRSNQKSGGRAWG